jgi:glycosyltransferase involved in cell wall biosynthesis
MSIPLCFFIDTDVVAGTELALSRLILSLDRDAWRPVLLHHGGTGLAPILNALSADGVALHRVPPMPDRRGLSAIPRFVRTLRSLGPMLFHAHLNWPGACKFGLAGALAARIPGVVATVHSFPDVEPTRIAAVEWALIARGVDRFLVASRHGANHLATTIPSTAARTDVVPNGIDPSAYMHRFDPALRKQLVRGSTRRLLLVSARLDPHKGHATLLAACRDMPDVQVVFAGEGVERASLEQLSARLGIRDRVVFLGFRTDIPRLLAACDVVVLPTLREAFGLALLEGMAAGRPVVSTRVGGPEEIIVDDESGLLVPPRNPEALAAAIRRILEDRSLALRLARGGRARVAAHFTFRSITRQTVRVYQDILRGVVRTGARPRRSRF